jgi:hypothetical protein
MSLSRRDSFGGVYPALGGRLTEEEIRIVEGNES